MEITPSPFAQMMGVEQAAPESVAPAEGFSEALAGAGKPIEGPPGGGYPPGAAQPGEGVETFEPIAQSQRPDFLPELTAELPLVSFVRTEEGTEGEVPDADAKTDPNLGAIAAAVVGALALQILPQDANPVLSLKIVEGGKATEAVEPVPAPQVPQPQLDVVETPPLPTAKDSPQAPVKGEAKPVLTPDSAPKAVAGDAVQTQPWQATSRRAFDDLAFLSKNLDVIDRVAEPAQNPTQTVQTTQTPEPSVVDGDFFEIQEDVAAPRPFPIEQPKTAGVANEATVKPATAAAEPRPVENTEAPLDTSRPPSEVAKEAPQPAVQPTPGERPQAPVTPNEGAEKVAEVAKAAGTVEPDKPAKAESKVDDSTPKTAVKETEQVRPVRTRDEAPSAEKDSAQREPSQRREVAPVAAKVTTEQTHSVQTTAISDDKTAIPQNEIRPSVVRSQPLARAETTEVIRQIVDRAEALAAARPRDGVVIHLEPKDLGSITLTVKSVGNQVDAQIGASNEHVRTALEQNRAHLGQAMEFRGLNLNSVSIDNQTTSSNFSQTQQQLTQQQDDRNARRQMAGPAHDDRSTTPNLETIRRSVRKADGVDIWT